MVRLLILLVMLGQVGVPERPLIEHPIERTWQHAPTVNGLGGLCRGADLDGALVAQVVPWEPACDVVALVPVDGLWFDGTGFEALGRPIPVSGLYDATWDRHVQVLAVPLRARLRQVVGGFVLVGARRGVAGEARPVLGWQDVRLVWRPWEPGLLQDIAWMRRLRLAGADDALAWLASRLLDVEALRVQAVFELTRLLDGHDLPESLRCELLERCAFAIGAHARPGWITDLLGSRLYQSGYVPECLTNVIGSLLLGEPEGQEFALAMPLISMAAMLTERPDLSVSYRSGVGFLRYPIATAAARDVVVELLRLLGDRGWSVPEAVPQRASQPFVGPRKPPGS